VREIETETFYETTTRNATDRSGPALIARPLDDVSGKSRLSLRFNKSQRLRPPFGGVRKVHRFERVRWNHPFGWYLIQRVDPHNRFRFHPFAKFVS
jgi:hypothetical protein